MSQEAKTQACPECGGLMRYERHDDVLEHAGRKRTIKTLGWWCTKCGEAILTGDALVKHERAFLQLKASADGVLQVHQLPPEFETICAQPSTTPPPSRPESARGFSKCSGPITSTHPRPL